MADLEILKGGSLARTQRRAAKRRSVRAKCGKCFLRVLIRKRSRSISAHSGHVPRRKED